MEPAVPPFTLVWACREIKLMDNFEVCKFLIVIFLVTGLYFFIGHRFVPLALDESMQEFCLVKNINTNLNIRSEKTEKKRIL